MKIATAAYPLDWFDDWQNYRAKLTAWVGEAALKGAELLVFPEYGAMELASLAGSAAARGLESAAHAVSEMMPEVDALHAELAASRGVHILAASAPVFDDRPRPVNRARFFAPNGRSGHQDKQIMTPFERDVWGIVPGGPLRIFDCALGRIGVLICYDAEFPLLARALIEAGAEILLVPSNTEAMSGYWRVRIAAMARALEGQCVVVHSPTVGPAPWCEAVSENKGVAAIYAPPDLGFPDTGILAAGSLDASGWVMAQVDPAAIAKVRREGAVAGLADWPRQESAAESVDVCRLRA